MDAIVGVWLTSLVGAAAFSTAGYILGQRGVYLPFLALGQPAQGPERTPASTKRDVHTMPTPPVGIERSDLLSPTVRERDAVPSQPAPPRAEAIEVAAAATTSERPKTASLIPREEPDDALKTALEKAAAATERARAAEAVKVELDRRIETLSAELRNEVVARATSTARADELADRLAGASEEAASLRHKVSVLDKQAKQLRGRVRALTTSEWHRRRDLEETEEMRMKLRDVYDRLERSSLPPSGASIPPSKVSVPPGNKITTPGMPAAAPSIPPNDELASLREDVARLAKENRDLRARALGSMPPKGLDASGSSPELDVERFRELLERVESVAGLKGAVIADETGTLLVGSGEHAEGLAAFGAYIRDASSRTERLLPLEGVEEVDIRDRGGMLLSTRVVSHSPSVCLVLLGAAEASLVAAKKMIKEQLRPRPL